MKHIFKISLVSVFLGLIICATQWVILSLLFFLYALFSPDKILNPSFESSGKAFIGIFGFFGVITVVELIYLLAPMILSFVFFIKKFKTYPVALSVFFFFISLVG